MAGCLLDKVSGLFLVSAIQSLLFLLTFGRVNKRSSLCGFIFEVNETNSS